MTDQFKRQLGVLSATALIIGEVIAVGIFLTPANMAKSLGSPFWVLVIWVGVGAMSLCGALCYGELAARFPEAGGSYAYLREAFGPAPAFLYGWMSLTVMDPGLTAALATGAASYVGYNIRLSTLAQKLVAIAAIIAVALINVRGVRLGAWFVRWLTVLKVGLLLLILCWAFLLQKGNWSNFIPFVAQRPGSTPLLGALAGGLVGAFFSFAGWWDVSKVTGEVQDPSRTMPRAFLYGLSVVTLVYVATSAAFVYLVPMNSVTDGETFAAQVGQVLFGATGARLFSAIVVIAVVGSLVAVMMSAPRVYFAMARDRLFFQSAAALHPRFNTPVICIALQAMIAIGLVLLGTFQQIISYFFFVVLIFIALTVVAIFKLRWHSLSVDYQTPGYPLTPVVFLLLVITMLVLLALNDPRQSFLGVGVVLLGLPIYYLVFRRREAHRGLHPEGKEI